MPENFELLEVGQIELMHNQTHDRLETDGSECQELRIQHDSLAAELVKRGVVHDTEIVCSESELGQKAPNYRRGFTDDICTQCAFGQLFPFCNLYKADYVKSYTCDSFRYFEILELELPHGFLMAQGKQTAIASDKQLDKKTSQVRVVISNGEAFGVAVLDNPAQIKTKEFDSEDWLNQHRVTPRERRQWWPDAESFYVYRLKEWYPYEGVKLYEDGRIIDEPKLTAKQWQIVSKAKELPKQIVLLNDAVSITENEKFILDSRVNNLNFSYLRKMDEILKATYEIDGSLIYKDADAKEIIPIYSLAFVRNPRMRVSKKNAIIEGKGRQSETETKQEDENMPFGIERREDEFCVTNTDTEEIMGCHETEEEAEAQLTALRINVEAEEGESAVYDGENKPRKRKPRKKNFTVINEDNLGIRTNDPLPEKAKKASFTEGLRSMAKSIGDFLKLAETEEKETKVDILTSDYGITQKEVDGELWHFTWSTNAFEDREKETFSTRSLRQYVDQAAKKQDKGFFNLWHIKGTDFAEKQWQMVIGRFLVEAGPYIGDRKGKAAKNFFREFPEGHPEFAPEGWGCSPEFLYLPEERVTGVYENIWITRTSTLPRMDAANVWTETSQLARSKNMALTDYTEDQIKTAIEVFKDEDFVKSLIREGEIKTAELEAAGIAHKNNEPNEPIEIEGQVEKINIDMEELAKEVGKQFTANLTPIAEAMATMASGLKEMESRLEKVEEAKLIKDKTEKPRFVFNMQRASEQDETIVTDDDGLKQQKPKETQVDDGDAWSQIFNK